MKMTSELMQKFGNKILIMVGIIVIPFAISSCSDDDGIALTKTQLLTSSAWKFSTVSTGDATVDALFQLLFTGFTITFNTDGTTVVTFPGEPNENGTWEFTAEETKVILDKGTIDEQTSDIITLNAATLVITITDPSISAPLTMTFTH